MTRQKSTTRANIAVGLAILLLSVSILSSFKRHFHVSGPPQSISSKYEASFYGLYDDHNVAAVNSSIKLDRPRSVYLPLFALSGENWTETWPSFSLHIRPPPHA
jgi:hypothetical protein